jgi:glycosyltransferase involved in cell wall biosynthesis
VKDHTGLVRAFALLTRQDPEQRARLVIVGEGHERASIEAEIHKSGLQDRVWLAGEQKDVPLMMRGFDVFVLPSIAEGISNTVLEAMASGLPVVATAVGGNPELVRAGQTDELAPAGDPAALAAALQVYLNDPERIYAQGREGRMRVEAEFSLDGMVERYRTLYERLAERN